MEIKNLNTNADVILLVSTFMEKYDSFERADRQHLLKIVEYLVLPRYEISGKAPIEEDFLKNKEGTDKRG
jgi:hypothetical protein